MKKVLILLIILIICFGCSKNKVIINENQQKIEIISQKNAQEEILDLGYDWFQITISEIIYPQALQAPGRRSFPRLSYRKQLCQCPPQSRRMVQPVL